MHSVNDCQMKITWGTRAWDTDFIVQRCAETVSKMKEMSKMDLVLLGSKIEENVTSDSSSSCTGSFNVFQIENLRDVNTRVITGNWYGSLDKHIFLNMLNIWITLTVVRLLCTIYESRNITGSTEISRKSATDINDMNLTPLQSDSVLNQLPWIQQSGCLCKQN